MGLVVLALLFFIVWKKRRLKQQGLPVILQETHLTNELAQDSAAHLDINQQNGYLEATQREPLVSLVRKRNSSYRSHLSSSASAGTVITYTEGMLKLLFCLAKIFKIVSSLATFDIRFDIRFWPFQKISYHLK